MLSDDILPTGQGTLGFSMSSGTSDLRRSAVRSLLGVQILATGSHVPSQVVTNQELESKLGFEPGWVEQRSGIRERRFAAPEIATSDLAVEAAKHCLDKAGVRRDEVDLLIVGTFTPDMLCPSTACLVQNKLGLNCPAMDIQAACAGFMYALITGAQFVAAGTSQRALIIGADCNSRIINPKDQRTYPLFGDGAGAVLLAPGSAKQGLVAYTLGSDGAGAPLLFRSMGGSLHPTTPGADIAEHYLQMDGKAVFKWAVRQVADTIGQVLAPAGMTPNDVRLFLAHQANARILTALGEASGLRPEQIYMNLDRYGNTSAGSIPLAMDEALEQGRFGRGDRLLLSGFGAGLTWGTALVEW